MSDIINTLRGPKLLPTGTVLGMYYILPVVPEYTAVCFPPLLGGYYTHEREYYRLEVDGEWHWSHTEASTFQKYPCYEEPDVWELPVGV
jgi:hypothetical protein